MYKSFSNFVFRSPLLSFDKLKVIFEKQSNLLFFLSDPQIQEAFYVASPILYKEIKKYMEGEIKENKEIDRIINSVVRYISRMSTRCTPFGLFASCGVGKIDEKTSLFLRASVERTTRLDMYYLCSLFQFLMKKEEIMKKMKFYPNSSLYVVGGKIRYVEIQYISDSCKYQIAEAEHTSYLAKVIKSARKGMSIDDLGLLLADKNISTDESTGFIHELIKAQILVPELSRSVTGDDYLSQIIEVLKKSEFAGKELTQLVEINRLLKILDTNHAGDNTKTYEKIIDHIKEMNIQFNEKYLFQVDTVRNVSDGTLGYDVVRTLEKAMEFLNKITPAIENESLKKFKEDFYNRYGDRVIPLMEVLDPEMGIGYPSQSANGDISPLIDDLFLPRRQNKTAFSSNSFSSILLNKTIKCLAEEQSEIVIEDSDIKDFKANWDDLPPTLYTLFEVICTTPQQPLIKVSSFSGSCGANLLGRFSHADSKMENLVKEIASKEQQLMSDVILAEIAHLPEARVGNVLSRPHIREYELLYLSESDLPRQNLLYMSDLLLSIEANRLVIRSKKLNKEIIPRLTTAHNYWNNSMPVYRFLCEMQRVNGRSGLYFNWGQLEEELPFRPRVRYSNVILSPASWIVKIEDIKHLFDIKDGDRLISAVTEWRKIISLPGKVLMPDSDNELYVDWQNLLSIRSLFSIIKKRQQVRFDEFLSDFDKPLVTGIDGKFQNECIVAFYKN